MQWNIKSSRIPTSIEELRHILLENRSIANEADFFSPRHPLELSYEELGLQPTAIEAAVQRILLAKERGEDVMIFGDYDADGICSTAILWEALKSIGIVARPFIPHREKHGYGLNQRSLADILAGKKPDLLITVDNGIVAHTAFAKLKEEEIDTILTDHHQPEVAADGVTPIFPPANIVVHSLKLCGATVAWSLARALNSEAAARSLDLAAIATISDQMALVGVNRAFVKHGLEALRNTERVGLQLLCAKADIRQEHIDVGSINFGIAPRLNAMGRLKHGMDALRLLCTKSMERAEALVHELNDTNTSRQELTMEMVEHAISQSDMWQDEHIIVVHSPEYHEGVIGLIAGRLMEKFYKPAIVMAVGDKVAKASARSINGVNIIDLIRLVKDDLLEAGGHPMAAGFGLLPEKIEVVRERLQKLAKEHISKEQLVPSVDIEAIVPMELVSLETHQGIQEFLPFGQANREPVFGIEGVKVVGVSAIGQDGRHLKVGLAPTEGQLSGNIITGLGWGMGHLASELRDGQVIDVAGVQSVNEWKNRKNIQLIMKDVKVRE